MLAPPLKALRPDPIGCGRVERYSDDEVEGKGNGEGGRDKNPGIGFGSGQTHGGRDRDVGRRARQNGQQGRISQLKACQARQAQSESSGEQGKGHRKAHDAGAEFAPPFHQSPCCRQADVQQEETERALEKGLT